VAETETKEPEVTTEEPTVAETETEAPEVTTEEPKAEDTEPVSGGAEDVQTNVETATSEETTAASTDTGCGASFGGGVVIISMLCLGVFAVARKKNED
jgi:hypothetical protein